MKKVNLKNILKFKMYVFFIALLITPNTNAQTPQKFSYQAVIRDANSTLITNTTINVKISILKDANTGNAVYAETHTVNTNKNGLVTLLIGDGNVTLGTFSEIDWASGTYFIKNETATQGDANYNISTTSQLLSVPYALNAKNVESIPNGTKEGDLLYWSGAKWSTLDAVLKVVNGRYLWFETGFEEFIKSSFSAMDTYLTELSSTKAAIAVDFRNGNPLNPEKITSVSVVYSTEQIPTLSNVNKIDFDMNAISNDGYNIKPITNLKPSTTYYYRLLINDVFLDDKVQTFTTPQIEESIENTFSINLDALSSATANIGISIKENSNPNQTNLDHITNLSVIYSTNDMPTLLNSNKVDFNIVDFKENGYTIKNIENLEPNTTYYYRLLINDILLDDSIKTFSTLTPELEESLKNTISIMDSYLSELYSNKAAIRIDINENTQLNTNIVTSVSIVYSTEQIPTLSNSKKIDFDIDYISRYGDDTNDIENLVKGTTYYYRLLINNVVLDDKIKSFTTNPVALGDKYQGGVLAYVHQPRDNFFDPNNSYVEGEFHGFVVAEEDIDTKAAWGCINVDIDGIKNVGFAHTTAIYNQAILDGCTEADIAVKLTANWNHNNYSDWLLPSEDLIKNGIRKPEVLSKLTGLSNEYYWSCTPRTLSEAYAINILTGQNDRKEKTNKYRIRAVREF
jgi:hypothetical protein